MWSSLALGGGAAQQPQAPVASSGVARSVVPEVRPTVTANTLSPAAVSFGSECSENRAYQKERSASAFLARRRLGW